MDRTCRKLRRFEPARLRRWLELPPEHGGLIEKNREPEDLLWALRERGLWEPSVRMLAYGLPEREAIWWSCMCVRHTVAAFEKPEQTAVEAAETWVRRQDPASKHGAGVAAQSCPVSLPGAWAAHAVAWSDPEPALTYLCSGSGAERAVLETAKRDGEDRAEERLQRFILSGIDVGNGGAGRLPTEEPARPPEQKHS